ncbi:MAG: phosphoserine phosphatase SerB [Phyllobacteriaceae bacterium]|nr:phosphoserine phosphatase SerB [Phyllobacteriaceae bacterium]
MTLVATLVTDPDRAGLSPDLIARAAEAIAAEASQTLAEGVAADLALPAGADAAMVDAALRLTLAGEPVDIVVQEAATRRKSILLADMDSTMIGQECIDELADMAGIKAHVAAITARSMNGEIAFEPALRERVALLRDLPVSVIDRVMAERISLAPGGCELVRTMKANGGYAALVSGGFTQFTARVAAMIGFDEHRANILHENHGRLAGTVAEPILGKQAKVVALNEIASRLGRSAADVIAVGDGANDLDMLARAGTGVALHAKPVVAAAARHRIDHGDLTALLYIQGYRRAEIVR